MRPTHRWKTAFSLLAAVLAAGPVAAGKSPFAGVWKVNIVSQTDDVTSSLIRIEDRGGKVIGTLLSTDPPDSRKETLEHFHADNRELRFHIRVGDYTTFRFHVYAPQVGGATHELFGSAWQFYRPQMLWLERTDQKQLDPKDAIRLTEGAGDFRKAVAKGDVKKRVDGLHEVVRKYMGKPIAYVAAQAILQGQTRAGVDTAALKAAAAQYLAAAAPYGAELQLDAAIEAADLLSRRGRDAALASEYAVRAAQLLSQIDTPVQAAESLQVLLRVLRKYNRDDEARTVDECVAHLERLQDQKIALTPEPLLSVVRRGEGSRVVLLELFTQLRCGPCIEKSLAVDALWKTYPPSQVVFLRYVWDLPLNSPDGQARRDAYEKWADDPIGGGSRVFIDGQAVSGDNGCQAIRKSVAKALKVKAEAQLRLSIQPRSGTCKVLAEVKGLKKQDGSVFLRFALVEEEVRYWDRCAQPLHRHLVRSFPGGVQGFALKGASARRTVMVDRKAVAQKLQQTLADGSQYLASVLQHDEALRNRVGLMKYPAGANPKEVAPAGKWPLELKRLKVIAFLQDEKSNAVLQAAQVDLPDPE